ncbi:MAG: hypothetical protein ABIH34_07595 [Nanoarchaeota archaeon]
MAEDAPTKTHAHKMTKTHAHKKKGNPLWMGLTALFAALFIISLFTQGFQMGEEESTVLGEEEAAEVVTTYINSNLLSNGITAEIGEVSDLGEIYKMQLIIQGQQFDSYVTKDGAFLFPEGIDLEAPVEPPAEPPAAPPVQAPAGAKAEIPQVEVFVMSHCPFGTQIEKGMLPVISTLKDKADIEVKFVNYAMHGKKEIDEQLLQYCMQSEKEALYYPYLQCFLEASNTDDCLAEVGVSKDELQECMDATDEEFQITSSFEDQASWLSGRYPQFKIFDAENKAYGVAGSPTLVINGQQVRANRDSASLLAAVCASFETAPPECSTQLSSTPPSPGFGYGTDGTDAAAAGCAV